MKIVSPIGFLRQGSLPFVFKYLFYELVPIFIRSIVPDGGGGGGSHVVNEV